MARDETARERSKDASLLDRRDYLRLTGAAAAAVTGFSAVGTAAEDYRTVTVPAGEVRTFRLRDGDTLENLLIDITADSAGYRIVASGDGWAIRNVGVRGYYDANVDDPLVVQCSDGGSGVIENVYLGDGGYDAPAGPTTGIFVHAYHAGDIEIDRVNVQDWAGNGIYASAPGNHDDHPAPGGGGTIRVSNSYGAGCPTSNFRLGTDGSYLKNCVSVGGGRGYWGYYNTTKLVDCDVHSDIVAGEDYWNTHSTVELKNTCVGGQTRTATGNDRITGSSAGTPKDRIPSGVPTSATEAASAATNTDGGSGTSDPTTTEPTDSDATGTLFELVANEGVMAEYQFTVEGSASKATSGVAHPADTDDADAVTDNGDGTTTVSGIAGNGFGDSYYVDGVVTSMQLDESKWTLTYGGTEVSVADVTFPNKLLIDGSATPGVASNYEFTVSGNAAKSTVLGSIQANDVISDGTISGQVIGGVDGYRFSGDITGFSLDGPASVRVEDGS